MTAKEWTSGQSVAENLVILLDSKLFKALSEPVRTQIVKYLVLNGRSNITAIAQALPRDRSVISRHLNCLHEVGVVSCVKESRNVFYEINSAFLDQTENIIRQIKKWMAEYYPRR